MANHFQNPIQHWVGHTPEPPEDHRLARLFDYTKFHIGIYLSAAGALITLIGVAAEKEGEATFLASLVGSPKLLLASFVLMFIAGVAGGLIASACTASKRYDEVWEHPHGPFGSKYFSLTGKQWARVEHGAFWLSAICFSLAILSAPAVLKWCGILVVAPQ